MDPPRPERSTSALHAYRSGQLLSDPPWEATNAGRRISEHSSHRGMVYPPLARSLFGRLDHSQAL